MSALPHGAGAERAQLLELAAHVHRRIGITIDGAQLAQLAAAVDRIRPRLSAGELLRLLGDAERGEWALDRLTDELTVQESYFLRNPSELAGIDWSPALRVWNPGCANGEEAYTLALLAVGALGRGGGALSILATDVAPVALERAREARYGEHSLRDVPAELRERHFRPLGAGRFEVGAAVRRAVRLVRHNLLADPIPPAGLGPFDVIVCRNVLIYFDAETARRTALALRRALAPGGLLVLGAADKLTAPPVPRRGAPAGRRARGRRAPPPPDPLDADAQFARGLALHASGDAAGAIAALRRALCLAPDFARAAFELGREHEALGDTKAARRAYRQALAALEVGAAPQRLLGGSEAGELGTACRARLERIVRERGLAREGAPR